jgi:hypothetical protein
MKNLQNRMSLERKLYMVYHQDGILDIVAGAVLLIFAAVIVFDQGAFIGLIAIPTVLYMSLKQRFSLPRMGYIRFETEKEKRQKLGLTLLFGLTAFIGLLAFYAFSGDLPENLSTVIRENTPLLFGLVLGLALVGVAYFLNNPRFYVYAILAVVFSWTAFFLRVQLGIGIALLGITTEVSGIATLLRFLQGYSLDGEG